MPEIPDFRDHTGMVFTTVVGDPPDRSAIAGTDPQTVQTPAEIAETERLREVALAERRRVIG
jgi:hypothetical protein